jgi:hypothetical protein
MCDTSVINIHLFTSPPAQCEVAVVGGDAAIHTLLLQALLCGVDGLVRCLGVIEVATICGVRKHVVALWPAIAHKM